MAFTKNKFLKLFTLSVISFQLVFSGIASAQEIQMVPVTPAGQPSIQTQPMQGQQPILLQTPLPLTQQPSRVPSPEKPSEFEQFVSGKIEITDIQFEILKKFEGISFSNTAHISADKISVPVRIVKYPEKTQGLTVVPIEVDAGFLIGTHGALSNAFVMVGIKSHLVVSTEIKQFGYDLFVQPPSTFAPVEKVPVGPDYVIGPGDEIKITVWGKVEGQWSIVVDRDGNISLPKVGIIGVTGLTFKELKETLHKEFSKYFTGFQMNVSMGALRTIRVYLVGNANKPGAYTVSSLSTLVNALFEAGGPSKTGTMRDIQVKRNGKTIVNFDMYDFLLKGDKTKDVRLMPEDVIFIPPIGHVAAIAGSVNTPAIYELKGETKIQQLIDMAGGLSAVAFKGRVQIERIVDGRKQVVFESEFDAVKDKDLAIQSGDVLKVFQIVQDKMVVRLVGAVQREGEYGFSSGMTIKDLLHMAGGLKYYAYNKDAELTRVSVTDAGPKTEKIMINIEKAISGDISSNIKLQENDYLFVRAVPEWQLYRIVTLQGEVKFPGAYTINKGEKLSALIERAGGYTDKAYLRGAVFTRERVRELQQRQLDEMVERLERELLGRGVAEVAVALSPEEAKIKEYESKQKKDFVATLKGVKAKGRMALRIEQPEILKKTPHDIELEEGDSLFIPSDIQSVQVIGSVYNQTAFVYDKDKGYSRYIDLAGGYTENADKKRVYILKADGIAVRHGGSFLGILWSKDSNRWELGSQELDSGDTIVVPEKIERIAWMRNIKDITQILFQIAVTAGVLIKF